MPKFEWTAMMDKLLTDTLRKFGSGHQMLKACEEFAELIRALVRGDADNIAEEMADAYIMLRQLELSMNNTRAIRRWEKIKLERLQKLVWYDNQIGGPEVKGK